MLGLSHRWRAPGACYVAFLCGQWQLSTSRDGMTLYGSPVHVVRYAKYISIQNEIYVVYQTVSCAILTGNKNSISSIGSERQNCWLRRAVPMRCWPAVLPPSRVLMLAFKLYAVVAQCRSLTLFVLMFAVVGCLAEGADLRGG